MARARNIKPGFFRNADLVDLSMETRLLFIGLWMLADREGRLEDRPKQIKMEIFPADNVDCDACLSSLSEIGMVIRYEVDGKRYLQVTNFAKHQNPHRDEKVSTIPDQSGNVAETVQAPKKHRANTVQAPCKEDASTVAIGLIPDPLIPEERTLEPSALVASKLPTCPQKEILALYAELLPELPQPRIWEGARQKNLSARWKWVVADLKARDKPHDTADGIDFFSRMFRYVARSDFLTGKPGPWCASLDWLVESGNFAKVIAGNYDNKAAA